MLSHSKVPVLFVKQSKRIAVSVRFAKILSQITDVRNYYKWSVNTCSFLQCER